MLCMPLQAWLHSLRASSGAYRLPPASDLERLPSPVCRLRRGNDVPGHHCPSLNTVTAGASQHFVLPARQRTKPEIPAGSCCRPWLLTSSRRRLPQQLPTHPRSQRSLWLPVALQLLVPFSRRLCHCHAQPAQQRWRLDGANLLSSSPARHASPVCDCVLVCSMNVPEPSRTEEFLEQSITSTEAA